MWWSPSSRTPEVTWTLETSKTAVPRLDKTQQTFTNLSRSKPSIQNARVWGGLHYRTSIDTGELIGDGIALVVLSQHFGRIECRASSPIAWPGRQGWRDKAIR